MKLQSAIEYLTTYGWVLLIIAVVLVAMLKLNIFNPNFLTPKIPPGACTITRNQYGGASFGSGCTNGLPEFVAQFDGSNSAITIPYTRLFTFTKLTVSAWINPTSGISGYTDEGIVAQNGGTESYLLTLEQGPSYPPYISPSGFIVSSSGENWVGSGVTPNINDWYHVVLTFDGSTMAEKIYVNGVLENSVTTNGILQNNNANVLIGERNVNSRVFNGLISNVQIYNTSLSANSVMALYQEGIGGMPINLQNLVGWWPLNGNATDYSGNGNNGAPTNIIYTSNWYSNYVQS